MECILLGCCAPMLPFQTLTRHIALAVLANTVVPNQRRPLLLSLWKIFYTLQLLLPVIQELKLGTFGHDVVACSGQGMRLHNTETAIH